MDLFLNVSGDNERSKLEELYLAHKYIMLYTSYSILKDWQLAEDAVHTSFLRLLNKLDTISDTKCNKTRNFMVIIVRNVSIDIYNKRKKRSEYGYDDFVQTIELYDVSVEDLVISQSGIDELINCISMLDKKYSDVLMLRYTYGYSDDEIAYLLGISNENVRIRLHRGRNFLKNKLNGVSINE
ncbi:MAG: RNA polymerase sigma factor [Ruminiclostridium sp.]